MNLEQYKQFIVSVSVLNIHEGMKRLILEYHVTNNYKNLKKKNDL